jgi:lipopolysaccharide biosynthesis glycosyltransferase
VEKERIDIVACTDKWYVMPTGVMMLSVCVNNPNVDIVFHVIVDENVRHKDCDDLKDITDQFHGKSVMFYPVSKKITRASYPVCRNWYFMPRIVYYRLWLAELLPESVEKVLYLDGDVIVRHSLLPLWNTDLNGCPIAAAPVDYMGATNDFYSRVNESPLLGYFNAGVLLINVALWRERHVIKDFLGYMEHHAKDIRFYDQDVLNYVFMREKIFLPLKYNMQTGFYFKKPLYDTKYEEEVRKSFMDPVILHYTGASPWERYNRYPHPLRSTFLKYQNMTKWRNVKYERRPLKIRMINGVEDLLRKWKLKSQITDCFIDIAPID